jgi:hypothetical protein
VRRGVTECVYSIQCTFNQIRLGSMIHLARLCFCMENNPQRLSVNTDQTPWSNDDEICLPMCITQYFIEGPSITSKGSLRLNN